MALIRYFINHIDKIMELTVQHLSIVLIAMAISITLGVIVGLLITFHKGTAKVVLYIVGILMTIPSLALFSLFIPILGIGQKPAIVGLVIYTQLPIIRNVYTGFMNIDPAIVESAKGMGLSPLKIVFKIKLPLALPVIFAGIRTAVVLGIGIGAIAAYIGAGGLGVYIFHGINQANDKITIIGAVLISLMTIIADRLLLFLQKRTEIV